LCSSEAAQCTYSLSPSSASVSTSGTNGSFNVTPSKSTCAWTAVANVSWLHTTNFGTGNGSVSYTVDSNSSSARSGTISVDSETFTVNQAGVPPTFASALDTTNLVWTTDGTYPWQVINNVTHDGADAVASGNRFAHNSASWIQTTVVGPGTIGFWWKVDSDVTTNATGDDLFSFDHLQFLVNDIPQDHILGQVGWNYREFPIPDGTNTLQWQYVKDAQFNSGNDSAWLDQVTWTHGQPISLAEALDTCGVHWSSDGRIPTLWTGQTNVTHDGKSGARSGTVYLNQDTWMETTVSGVSNVSFWWKVSSQTNYDFLEFYTNDILAKRISGEVNWQSNFFNIPASNTVSLKWRYAMTNGIYTVQGQGVAWVDQVTFNPAASAAPIVTLLGSNPTLVECHGTFTDPGATAQDGCTLAFLTVSTHGSVNPNVPGTYFVNYVATNASGSSTTNSRTVTVVDTTPPAVMLNGSDSITVECHGSFTDPGASAEDLCAGSLSVTTNSSLNLTATGSYTVSYIATDPSGNSATNTRTVNVVDTTPPQVAISGTSPLTIECHSGFADPGASADDVCAGSLPVATNSSVNPNLPGTYSIVYIATDPSDNSVTNTRTVNVVDITPPQITLEGANPMTIECHGTFTDPGASAQDLCAGSLAVTTNGLVDPNSVGSYNLQYVATDSSGNSVTNTRVVNVVDTIPPQITINGLIPLMIECHETFVDPGATATDVCAGDLPIVTNSSVDANSPGSYSVGYIATDPSGNAVTNTRTVNVVDSTPPAISFSFSNLVLTVNETCTTTLPDLTSTNYIVAVDNCSSVTVTQAPLSGSILTPGTNQIVLTAYDASGNATSSTNLIVVIDSAAPTLVGPADLQVNADPDQCSVTNLQLGESSVSDNCGTVIVTNNAPTAFGVGTNIVIWTATDAKGNSTNASQQVIVLDNQPPSITAPSALLLSADLNTNVATGINLGTPVTSDNCGIFTVANDAPGAFPVGANIVTWTVVDLHGNISTATQQVIVNANRGPHRITSIVHGVVGCNLTFTGMANGLYIVQASSNLIDWVNVHTNTAGTNGTWSYTDSVPPGGRVRFYRSAQP
jgi:hypothetical protein